jgi:hypothetical protein
MFRSRHAQTEVGWRKLHNEELQNWYSSPNRIRVIRSRGMRWAGNVARIETKRTFVGKPERKDPRKTKK